MHFKSHWPSSSRKRGSSFVAYDVMGLTLSAQCLSLEYGTAKMKKISALHKEWIKDTSYRKEYDALVPKLTLDSAKISARTNADLKQELLAKK